MEIGLLKVPLLLSAAYCIQVAASPPQPTPKPEEEAKFVGIEPKGFRGATHVLGQLVIRATWFTGACESVLIVARSFPAHPISRRVLAVLLRFAAVRSSQAGMTGTFLAGWALIAAGALIRRWCFRELGRFFTFELAVHEDHKLITTGPYRVVRHPSYAGGIISTVGLALITTGAGSWWHECVLPWSTPSGLVFNSLWLVLLSGLPVVFFRRPRVEDKILRAQFGKQWDDWAQQVPYMLFPGIY